MDALVDSGADGSFEMQGYDTGTPLQDAPVAEQTAQDLQYSGFADMPAVDYDALSEVGHGDLESQPMVDVPPATPAATDFPPLSEEPAEELPKNAHPVERKSLNLGDLAKGPVADEPAVEAAPKASRFTQESARKKGKGLSLGNKNKPSAGAKTSKGAVGKGKGGAAKVKQSAPPKQKRTPSASVEDEEDVLGPKKAKSTSKPMTVMMPESPLSQLVTIIEVVVAGGLVFFGASQVGNILITQIVSGMLGG